MSISAAQLVWRKSVEMSNAATNGGLMSAIQAVDGVKNNIWPDVPQSERDAGSNKYRKIHIHNTNEEAQTAVNGLTLFNARVFIETYTPGDDAIYLLEGTADDEQGDLTGSEDLYGGGHLNAGASSGATFIDVAVEDSTKNPFGVSADARLIRISSESTVGAGDGDTQFVRLDASTGVADQGGNVLRLTFESGETLDYDFTAGVGNTRVAAVIEAGDVVASYDTVNKTGSGVFTALNNLIPHNVGGVEDFWTITFLDNAGNFKIEGVSNPGPYTGFNYASDASPINTDFTKPFFTIKAAAWNGGTNWTTGTTVTFYTRPAAIPVWYRRIIPVGASSLSGNSVIVGITGESE
jgi:hypothetical protein